MSYDAPSQLQEVAKVSSRRVIVR